jgi:hypothetical protein
VDELGHATLAMYCREGPLKATWVDIRDPIQSETPQHSAEQQQRFLFSSMETQMNSTDPALSASLHRNPFWMLWASTRDHSRRIIELADEKALTLDAEDCERARATLTTPRTRLAAELSWLPGVSPSRVSIGVQN